MSKEKEMMESADDNTTDVADMFANDSFDMFRGDTIAVTGGIGDMLALIRKLLSMNLISDAVRLMDMWTNDGKYTLAEFKTAVREALAKIGINFNGEPVAPRLAVEDDGGLLAASLPVEAKGRLTKEEVIKQLEKRGVKTKFLPPAMLAMLIQLALTFGLPFLKGLIDRIINAQAKGVEINFGMLF